MNWLNHFIFSVGVCLLFIPVTLPYILLVITFSIIFSVLIDFDHKFSKRTPWYRKRTWIQEPFGLIIIGLPISFILGMIDEIFFFLILIPYALHIFLDYLCIFETYPLAPFSKIRKREGFGIFIPDNLFLKSENSRKWEQRVKAKNIKGISKIISLYPLGFKAKSFYRNPF